METKINEYGLADAHNRRRDINAIAQWYAERDLPFLAWPQDKELIQLSDIPELIDKAPRTTKLWLSYGKLTPLRSFFINTGKPVDKQNARLRAFIVSGNLYAVTGKVKLSGAELLIVTEYTFLGEK